MWPISSRNIECDKPQGTICKGPKGILTIVLEPIRAFFLGPKWLLRTQIFEKKGKISSEKKQCGLFFLVLSNVANLRRQFIKVQKLF